MPRSTTIYALLFSAALLLNTGAWGQTQPQDQASAARSSAGCGPSGVDFDVKTDKKQHPAPKPEAGKAMLYVLEQQKRDPQVNYFWNATMRIGLDGAWVGATKGESYLFFPIEPGTHRLCIQWQSSLGSQSKLGSATSIEADAGKIYYFRVTVEERVKRSFAVKLEPIDEADAQFLISSLALSVSHPKEKAADNAATADSR